MKQEATKNSNDVSMTTKYMNKGKLWSPQTHLMFGTKFKDYIFNLITTLHKIGLPNGMMQEILKQSAIYEYDSKITCEVESWYTLSEFGGAKIKLEN